MMFDEGFERIQILICTPNLQLVWAHSLSSQFEPSQIHPFGLLSLPVSLHRLDLVSRLESNQHLSEGDLGGHTG